MRDDLPPLPEPNWWVASSGHGTYIRDAVPDGVPPHYWVAVYTADQMRAYARAAIADRDAEIERLRMQLVACGVVAMSNTAASASWARDIHPDYRCASVDDVARAVDREMAERNRADERDAEIARLHARIDAIVAKAPGAVTIEDAWERREDDLDVLASYDRDDGRRSWISVGAWLLPGDVIAVVHARQEKP